MTAGRRLLRSSIDVAQSAPVVSGAASVTVMDQPAPAEPAPDDRVAVFVEHRPRLFGLAYRMLGSATEAEDIVQDVYLRWDRATSIRSPRSWLTKVATNLCLNHLSSARVRREHYPGPWLPEPVLTDGGVLGPVEAVEQRESVSMAVLVLLERLSPVERAVFVLREAFGHRHQEIAEILEIEEAHSRQLLHRAREYIAETRIRNVPDAARHRSIVEAFIGATRSGELAELEALLAEDVVAWSDGGGATAARRPVSGRSKVLRYLIGIGARPEARSITSQIAPINGEPALLIWDESTLVAVVAVDIVAGRIVTIRIVLNETKLTFAAGQASPPE